MLGLIGNKGLGKKNESFPVTYNGNCYKVNLKPWDVVVNVEPSPQYPTGKKVIPAASQVDFQRILDWVPDMKKDIGTLEPQQEKDALASLSANCAWFKEQQAKEKQPENKTPISTSPTKQ